MLLNTQCPSWLYEVRVGATTVWERWDGLDENGECPIGDDGTDMMISYNQLRQRRGGRVPLPPCAGCGAHRGRVPQVQFAPVVGGGITEAEGTVGHALRRDQGCMEDRGRRDDDDRGGAVGTECTVVLPSGEEKVLGSGEYTVTAKA